MNWSVLLEEATEDYTLALVVALLFTAFTIRRWYPQERRRLIISAGLGILHLALLPLVAWLRDTGSSSYSDYRVPCQMASLLSATGMATFWVFIVTLPRLRVQTPRIVSSLASLAASIIVIIVVARRAGYSLSGIIATSTVVGAMFALALQDTLGNLFGGLLLQMDSSIRVGDWIKLTASPKIQPFDLEGKVVEVNWRYTAIETRNWETLLIPNSVLVRNQVLVLNRSVGRPPMQRRWVWFHVDHRWNPSEVMKVIEEALAGAVIKNVATDPPPNIVCMDIRESMATYAVRYWIVDLAPNDPTDSALRIRITHALKRAGIPLGIPAQAVFLTNDSADRKELKQKTDLDRRMAALSSVELFRNLDEEERNTLARGLRHCPFAKGEFIFREGAEGDSLYMIVRGEVAVEITIDGQGREVARIGPGQVFGEMSLMTGEKRSATITASVDAECYRLDRAAFQELLESRPQVAERVAEILAKRRIERAKFAEKLDEEATRRQLAEAKSDLLGKIRSFFGMRDGK
jgi:small-conductance mechanosensitive channel/CRP-like cAMP-binding protein